MTTEPAIRVEGLGKRYAIGARQKRLTFREMLTEAAMAPIRRLRRFGEASDKPEDTIWALKDVSFDIQRGEVVGIIGSNGAGKSTLLKILSQITCPTEGRVELRGRVGSLLEVGTGFHRELTGRENIFLNGAILGMKRAEIARKFDEIVEFSGVEKFIDTPVKRYSSGMYVRLAFAVAAHMDPEILLVDEVLSVGDVAFRKKCMGQMNKVATEGSTVLFVSHNLDAIRHLCRRTTVLRNGAVQFDGDTSEAMSQYMNTAGEARREYAILTPDGQGIAARAVAVKVEGGNGEPAIDLPVGEPWQVRVRFVVNETLSAFVVALGIRAPSHVTVRTTWDRPRTVTPGTYEALFSSDGVVLGPGRYGLTTGLSIGMRSIHYVENAGFLEIAPYSEQLELPRFSGIVLNQMKVRVEKLSDAME